MFLIGWRPLVVVDYSSRRNKTDHFSRRANKLVFHSEIAVHVVYPKVSRRPGWKSCKVYHDREVWYMSMEMIIDHFQWPALSKICRSVEFSSVSSVSIHFLTARSSVISRVAIVQLNYTPVNWLAVCVSLVTHSVIREMTGCLLVGVFGS